MIGMMKPILFSASIIAMHLQLAICSNRVMPVSTVILTETQYNQTSRVESLSDFTQVNSIIAISNSVKEERTIYPIAHPQEIRSISMKIPAGIYHKLVMFHIGVFDISLSTKKLFMNSMIRHS